MANHNALRQLTNHNTFSVSEGGPSSNPELIEWFVSGWGESMRACSSTPPKQHQDFVKEHNRTPLSEKARAAHRSVALDPLRNLYGMIQTGSAQINVLGVRIRRQQLQQTGQDHIVIIIHVTEPPEEHTKLWNNDISKCFW